MSLDSVVCFDSYDVDQRLSELGLGRQFFVTAALQGLSAFTACTPNHPPTYPGTSAWAETVRSLREELFSSGWTRKNEVNLPLVINEAKTIAVTVASGDENTARKDEFPCTRSAKGPRTAEAIRINKQQQKFDFMEDPRPIVASLKVPGRSTWLFLVYRDMQASELRYELSRPISMADDGHVDDWAERILFPPTPFGINTSILNNNDGEQSPEIIIEIKKLG